MPDLGRARKGGIRSRVRGFPPEAGDTQRFANVLGVAAGMVWGEIEVRGAKREPDGAATPGSLTSR